MNWLFLRGLSREQRHWGRFPTIFAEHVAGARVFCLDLPGTGTEHARPSPATTRAIADDLRERWIALRDANEGPWGLLAMSLGGMVAMEWCAANPGDFARLVLSGTSAGNLSPAYRRFEPAILPGVFRAMLGRDPVERERNILASTTRLVHDRAAVAEEWARYQSDAPVSRANVLRQIRAGSRFRAPARLDLPVLVLAGAHDPMVHPSCARVLASRLAAPLELHPDAGHEMALDAPVWLAARVAAWIEVDRARAAAESASGVRASVLSAERPLPLVIEPIAGADRGADRLVRWIGERRAELEQKLIHHGAFLLRGFDVGDARAFERVARAFEPKLENEYLGTSPRNGLTDYVFSASELPPYYPIPQHCEMSFTRRPPRRLFFTCLLPPDGPGGETPLADFRAVYRDLDPEVRARFERKGVKNIRNYAGPDGGSRLDPWKLKRWDEMFGTTDRAAAERACEANGFEFTWGPRGALRLTNVQPAIKPHPVTGEPVWFNHAQVFHLSAVADEYRRIARRQGRLRYDALAVVAEVMVRLKALTTSAEDQSMHCTYGDGTAIDDRDMDRVRDAIWKNMVFIAWRKGDVLVIDNDSVSHGRMPYRGPRNVAVAWA